MGKFWSGQVKTGPADACFEERGGVLYIWRGSVPGGTESAKLHCVKESANSASIFHGNARKMYGDGFILMAADGEGTFEAGSGVRMREHVDGCFKGGRVWRGPYPHGRPDGYYEGDWAGAAAAAAYVWNIWAAFGFTFD